MPRARYRPSTSHKQIPSHSPCPSLRLASVSRYHVRPCSLDFRILLLQCTLPCSVPATLTRLRVLTARLASEAAVHLTRHTFAAPCLATPPAMPACHSRRGLEVIPTSPASTSCPYPLPSTFPILKTQSQPQKLPKHPTSALLQTGGSPSLSSRQRQGPSHPTAH